MSFCLQLSRTLARTLIRNLLYSGQIFKILREILDLYQMYGMLPYYYKYQTLSNSDQQPSGGHHTHAIMHLLSLHEQCAGTKQSIAL